MATLVSDLARSVVAVTASDSGLQLAGKWINERYAEMVGRVGFHQLRHYGSLYAPAPITAGTVNVTQGSTSAVLSTALADNTTQIGWSFRANVVWYVITAINADKVTLTLDSPYSETTNTTASYNIVKRYLPIQPAARWVDNVAHPRRRKRLRHLLQEQFESKYPSRMLVAAFPWCWTEASRFVETTDISTNLGSTGQKLIEVYPPSNIAETYAYTYWALPAAFALTDTLPPEIDANVLRDGVLIDYYTYQHELMARKGNFEGAMYYANLEARQRTVWETKIQAAIVADAAYKPGLSIELDLFSYANEGDEGDIMTAHDQVFATWNFP